MQRGGVELNVPPASDCAARSNAVLKERSRRLPEMPRILVMGCSAWKKVEGQPAIVVAMRTSPTSTLWIGQALAICSSRVRC